MPSLKKQAWLLLAASIILQLVILRSTRALKDDSIAPPSTLTRRMLKRGVEESQEALFNMPYDHWYSSASAAGKPFVLLGLLGVLAFLFSFIGISASDFFCPNLATIAAYLGLNESTAGVTFLAFGNGSPDVFSTFSALKGGTFSLAIGELIGAASFIISIIVGTIALIQPFHVPRAAFLRDVWFFTIAVILVVLVLHDGHLTLYESGAMVALYIAYVLVVIGGNWWSHRQEQKETFKALGWDQEENGTVVPGVPSIHLPEPELSDDGSSNRSRRSSVQASPASGSPLATPHRIGLRRSRSHHSPGPGGMEIDTPRANFSLLGAIEFRDVVNSLRKESESRGTSPSKSPMDDDRSDYFGAAGAMYGHRRASSLAGQGLGQQRKDRGRQRSVSNAVPFRGAQFEFSPVVPLSPAVSSSSSSTVKGLGISSSDSNPWKDQPGRPASTLNTPDLLGPPTLSTSKPQRPTVMIPKRKPSGSRIPSISITDPSGLPGTPPTEPGTPPVQESRFGFRRRSRTALRILFPSLQSFRHKSYIGMFLAITSVPAVLALTLTLPVVDDGTGDEGGLALPIDTDYPADGLSQRSVYDEDADIVDDDRMLSATVGEELHHLVEGGFSPLHSPLGRIHHSALRRMASRSDDGSSDGWDQDEVGKELLEEIRHEEVLEFHRELTAVQCILGPAFCVSIIFGDMEYYKWIMLASILGGLVAAGMTLRLATHGQTKTWRLVRCFAGFICSMVWIAAIADEVVSVLQAVGEILGLSDAIIGLTIFAVGNSLADLVANVTVAQFAPAMAYAACFGGPMLNLLLGIGGSGTYHMFALPHKSPVKLRFSPTLWVSATGLVLMLVATAIFVPLNGYKIDRRWACCLIVAYVIVMVANVAVEIKTGRD